MDYSIWDRTSSQMEYQKVKAVNDLRQEIRRALKKIDVNYVRKIIGAFLRRVYSVEKHEGELIIDEHC